jgi:hypothetical protein
VKEGVHAKLDNFYGFVVATRERNEMFVDTEQGRSRRGSNGITVTLRFFFDIEEAGIRLSDTRVETVS